MSNDPADLARRYPSLAQELGGAPAPAKPAPPAADPQLAEMQKRYPSLAQELKPEAAAKVDQELAKRYPSLRDEGKDPGAEKDGGAKQDGTALELEAPEGIDAASASFGEFRQVAGELGLDKEKAAKLLDLYLRDVAERDRGWDRQVERWYGEVTKDAEIQAGLPAAETLIARFGSPELQAFLDTGVGNNPHLVRFVVRIAQAFRQHGVGR